MSTLVFNFRGSQVINRIHHATPETLRKWFDELEKGGATPIYERLLAETPSGLNLFRRSIRDIPYSETELELFRRQTKGEL